ncbi:hypothetical protein ABEB36_000613 [Hypothenemus hampei]|uniref:RNA helicase n=1 Tax=Hypothenemus hampei TaxID=57062 RepID=A0ABD1FBU8_HYPHA
MLAHSLTSKERTRDVISTENVSFTSLLLPANVLKGLQACGFEKPSPIQAKALPIGRSGFDVIVKSKSGTGKTLVFGLIALESINLDKHLPQVLILAPTREIAFQIQDVLTNIGQFLDGLKVECFIGGLPLEIDKAKCKTCHVAVGTPGRIKQLITESHLTVEHIKILVLDEADKLIEESFSNGINEIYNSLSDRKQILMCSATYPNEMEITLGQYMKSPVLITVELETPLLLGLKQYVRLLKTMPNIVQQTKIKNEELIKVLSTVPFTQCLVFSNYQSRAESISNFLNSNGWNSVFISASQKQADRLSSLSDLKDFKRRILVTTDLTARGIDAPNLDLVINYDIPVNATTYLHRMGRAGRFGSTGCCINLAFNGTESEFLQNIVGVIGGETLSIPILDKRFQLDTSENTKEQYLFGKLDLSVKNLNSYSDEIKAIRNSLSENKCKKQNRKSKTKKKNGDKKPPELNGDLSSILHQMAAGTFELDDCNQASTKELNPCASEIIESDKSNKNSKEQDGDPFLLLKQLADDGEITETSCTPTSDHIFGKNTALVGVAKILSNMEMSSDEYNDVSPYFCPVDKQEKIQVANDKCNFEEVMENIFSLSYNAQISPKAERWQNLLPEQEKCKLSSDYQHKEKEEEEEEYEEQNYDEDYDFELEKEIQVNYSNPVDDYSFMKWVPVQSRENTTKAKNDIVLVQNANQEKKVEDLGASTSGSNSVANESLYEEKYKKYFEHCSSVLWHNGLNFENVQEFDQWFFNNWENQLNSIRNFVQSKIYFEEMSKHS